MESRQLRRCVWGAGSFERLDLTCQIDPTNEPRTPKQSTKCCKSNQHDSIVCRCPCFACLMYGPSTDPLLSVSLSLRTISMEKSVAEKKAVRCVGLDHSLTLQQRALRLTFQINTMNLKTQRPKSPETTNENQPKNRPNKPKRLTKANQRSYVDALHLLSYRAP